MSEKLNYKDTIRLPKTTFPMKANLKELAIKVNKEWEKQNIYQKLREKSKGNPKFILHDGPPYANGNIHLGTALNKILKDIIIKGRQLLGYDAPLVLGWDCHGLPIEWKVEENYKKQGLKKEEIDIVEFRAECRKFAAKWLAIQKEEFKSLGLIADFDNPYNTMDTTAEALIYQEITKLLMNGSLYIGKKPIMWSVVEKTALAEAEIEYYDKVSDTVYVGFPVINAPNQEWQNALLVVWTTTPWTLPANEALAYNSSLTYGLYKAEEVKEGAKILKGTKLVIAENLAPKVLAELLVTKSQKLDVSVGLKGVTVNHPLHSAGYQGARELIAAEFVEDTVGSGIVHIAPAYGLDDFYLGQKNNLPCKDIINDDGTYNSQVMLFGGLHIFKANGEIIKELEATGTLLAANKLTHSYPHSWRSKKPLIYRLTSQWFLNLQHNNLRSKVLSLIEKDINFLPIAGKKRLSSMVNNRPDWCLSRQRLWGVPIAVFVHKDSEEVLKDSEVNQNIINAFLKEGSDAWFKGDPYRFLPNKYNKQDYKIVKDVIDVWFDSGATHVFVLRKRPELQAPADIYIEGSDQHRGWFQSSLILSAALYNQAPYKNLLTHGFVLDGKSGDKMSKSLGNVITPQEIINKYGVDILRLWVSASDYRLDIRISEEILNQQVDTYRKIRNTLKYMLGNLTYLENNHKLPYAELTPLEQFILHKVYVLHSSFVKCFTENYEFHVLFNEIYNFITLDLSALFFDIRKDTLYCDSKDEIKFKSCLTVMEIVFDYVIKWLSPFITFTAEEAFSERYQHNNSIMLQTIQKPQEAWYNVKLAHKWERIRQIRKVVLGALEEKRAAKVIGTGLEADVTVYLQKADIDLLGGLDFATICITSTLKLEALNKKPKNAFIDEQTKDIAVIINKKEGPRCERCWKIIPIHPQTLLCERCTEAIR